MTIILFLGFLVGLVVALERHDRRTRGLPRPTHGADSTIAFTDLDHDFDRVLHDTLARPA